MKKVLLFISIFVAVITAAQSLPLVPGFTNINQKYQWVGMKPPPDTIYSKFGFAQIGDTLYVGNGTKWLKSFIYISNNQQPGDRVVIDPTNNYLTNQHPDQSTCYNSSNIGLSHVNGLVYAYTSGFYNINCVQYTINTGGTVTLVDFDGTAGQFRTDAIILRANAGVVVLKGENSDDQVGGSPTIDPATDILLSYVTINSDNEVVGVSSETVYYDNKPGEWTHTTFGGATVAYNDVTNPLAPSDSAIKFTLLPNNSGTRFNTSTMQSSAGKRLSFLIRHNAAVATARTWTVRKMNGAAQVNGSVSVTLTAARGFNGTAAFNNVWQLISIPLDAFGGQDAYNGWEFRNSGTGGTVLQFIDSIRVESGVTTTTGGNYPGDGPDRINGLASIDVLSNLNNHSLTISNGTTAFKSKDSVGAVINNPWASWTDNTSTGTLTINGNNAVIAGTLGYNMNNYLEFPLYVGAENWTYTDTIIPTAKNNTSRGAAIGLKPVTGGDGIFLHAHWSDTTGYSSFTSSETTSDFLITNKAYSQFVWSAGDTITRSVQKIQRTVIYVEHNKINGSESRIVVNGVDPRVGTMRLYFYSGQTMIGLPKLVYDEIKNPDVAFVGPSTMWGGQARSYLESYRAKLYNAIGGFQVTEAGPGEATIDYTYRLPDILRINPKVLIFEPGPNDPNGSVNIDSSSKRLQRFLGPVTSAGIKVVIVNTIPQTTESVVTYNDTLAAIATRYGCQLANIYNILKGAGTAMNSIYDYGDGIHPNSAGHNVIWPVVFDKYKKLSALPAAPVTMQLPPTADLTLSKVYADRYGKLYIGLSDNDTSNILNQRTFDAAHIQTGANALIGNNLYVGNELRAGGFSMTSPVLWVNKNNDGYVRAVNLLSKNLSTDGGGGDPEGETVITGGKLRIKSGASTAGSLSSYQQYLKLTINYPQNAGKGFIIQPGSESGYVGSGWVPFEIQDISGVSLFRTDSVGTPYIKTVRNGSAASADSVLVLINGHIGAKNISGGSSSTYNNQTGTTYTLQSSDNGKIVTLSNASSITLTVPSGLPAGFHCDLVQLGAGQVTITASSTTIHNYDTFTKLKGQYSAASIIMYATDTFVTQGRME